jgi:hypothetical protein
VLYLVLILVLAALGLLVAALVTSQSLFAWISIALSLLAAGALFLDWLSRRRAERRAASEPAVDEELADEEPTEAAEPAEPVESTTDSAAAEVEPAEGESVPAAADETVVDEEPVQPVEEPAPVQPTETLEAVEPVDAGAVPDEEETDAADLLIVCELDDQVIVVDEHPRYHLAECRWLVDRDTIPIAVSEARELGFTPCARCGPDARLAERARRKRRAGAS